MPLFVSYTQHINVHMMYSLQKRSYHFYSCQSFVQLNKCPNQYLFHSIHQQKMYMFIIIHQHRFVQKCAAETLIFIYTNSGTRSILFNRMNETIQRFFVQVCNTTCLYIFIYSPAKQHIWVYVNIHGFYVYSYNANIHTLRHTLPFSHLSYWKD